MTKAGWIAIALLAGCANDDDHAVVIQPPPAIVDAGTTANVFEWRARVVTVDNDVTSLVGIAVVREVRNVAAFTASLQIRNDATGAIRPWHVHVGTCETGGSILGEDRDYPRLSNGLDGTAVAAITIRGIRLEPGGQYHVDIHASDDMLGTIIACGDLILL